MDPLEKSIAMLDSAYSEAIQWLSKLEAGEEDAQDLLPNSALKLFSPEEHFSLSTERLPAGNGECEWSIGLAGHGWNNVYFCCRLRTCVLNISVQVPYRTLLTTDAGRTQGEQEAFARKRLVGTCSLICLLLETASAHLDYVQKRYGGGALTVTCDISGCAFCVYCEDELIAEGDSMMELISFLGTIQTGDASEKGEMIFWG